MKRCGKSGKFSWRFLAAATPVLSLILASCTAQGTTSSSSTSQAANLTKIVSVVGSEPQNPLIPANTFESGGGLLMDLMFAGLVHYKEDGTIENDIAKSIETKDSQNYTITLRDNAKFEDGTPVNANSFVRAWNDAVHVSNAYANRQFFEDIEGFENAPGPDGKTGTKDDVYGTTSTLSGLKVVNDTTFTVKLKTPISDFAQRLGYYAFYPLPDAYFKDKEAFGKHPIGNGPYKFAAKDAWKHDVEVNLVRSDSYNGPRVAQNGGVNVKIYAQDSAAYSDLLAGNLDIVNSIPDSALATYKDDLGEGAVNKPSAGAQFITFPQYLEHFGGKEGHLRRRAISRSIDRKLLIDTIFKGTKTPSSDFTSPVVAGWVDNIPGSDVLKYDPKKAKEEWEEANKISPWSGKIEIAYNADASHQAWVDAVANSIKNTLGIEAVGKPYPTFKPLRVDITNRTIKAAFRNGWKADYPGIYNFLGPLYTANAGANDSAYNNPEFDKLLKQGISEIDQHKASELFLKAQEILFQELPAIPLWYSNLTAGYNSKNVKNVHYGWDGVPLLYKVTK